MKWNEYATREQLSALETAAKGIFGVEAVEVKQEYSGLIKLWPEKDMDLT